MIEKERLKELIEQGATIYAVTLDDEVGFINFIDYEGKILENVLKFRVKTKPDLSNWYGCEANWSDDISLNMLFETKEEAEFSLEFQNIPRTETLNLPLFNNLPERLYIPFVRFNKEENIWLAYVLDIDSDEIAILFKDIDERVYDCIFQKPVTKENYLEACKMAKKLFLGENDEQ